MIPELVRSPGKGIVYQTLVFLAFLCGSISKESACKAGYLGLIPGLGRSPEEGMATHSSTPAWRIPMDTGVW